MRFVLACLVGLIVSSAADLVLRCGLGLDAGFADGSLDGGVSVGAGVAVATWFLYRGDRETLG